MMLCARTAAWDGGWNKPLFVFPTDKARAEVGAPGNVRNFSVGTAYVSMASNGYGYSYPNEELDLHADSFRFYSVNGDIANFHGVCIPQVLKKNVDYRINYSCDVPPQRVFCSGYRKSGDGYAFASSIFIIISANHTFNSGDFDLWLFGFCRAIAAGSGDITYSEINLERL